LPPRSDLCAVHNREACSQAEFSVNFRGVSDSPACRPDLRFLFRLGSGSHGIKSKQPARHAGHSLRGEFK
jgi:hypothetical protein